MAKQSYYRPTVSSFLSKLLTILEDKEFQQTISWIQTLDGFKITNINEFTEQILPKYFKHRNLSSFIRQLNLYGFMKVKSQKYDHMYQNNNFIRGNRSSIKKIERKGSNIETKNQKNSKIQKFKQEEMKSQEEIHKIKERQMILEEKFKEMSENNKKIFNQNMTIVSNVKKQNRKQDKILSQIFKTFRIESSMKGRRRSKNRYNDELELSGRQGEFVRIKQDSFYHIESVSMNQVGQEEDYLELDKFEELEEMEDEYDENK